MSKKGTKQLQRRLLNETSKHREQELLKDRYKSVAEAAQEEAERYKTRFREFGSNVETIETEGLVQCLKWEISPQAWGNYIISREGLSDDGVIKAHREALKSIVQGLMDGNMVQFIDKTDGELGPLGGCTYAVKLYVVPWEQMPHRKTIELSQYFGDDPLKQEAQNAT